MKSMHAIFFSASLALMTSLSLGCGKNSVGYRESCANGETCDEGTTCSPTLQFCLAPGETGAPCTGAADCTGGDACRKGVCSEAVEVGGVCEEHEDCASSFQSNVCTKVAGETSGVCRSPCNPDATNPCLASSQSCCGYVPLAIHVCVPSSFCQ